MPYRATERTEARRAQARERIVRAAHELVAAGGFGAASVAAVATRAGVATGTVYRHFSSKGELFAEVFRRAAQHEVDPVAQTPDLPTGVEAFARRALAGRRLAWALLAEPVDPIVEAERLAFRRAYRDAFLPHVRHQLTAPPPVGGVGRRAGRRDRRGPRRPAVAHRAPSGRGRLRGRARHPLSTTRSRLMAVDVL